jgi:hypothetical protein
MDSKTKNAYVVEPEKMNASEKLLLAQKVYTEAHNKVFRGTNFLDFYKTVFSPPTLLTKIKIYTNGKQIIGYSSFQVYEIKHHKETMQIIMSEMCMVIPQQQPTLFVMMESIKYWMKNLNKNLFILDTLISPFIYKKCCAMAYELYPRHSNKTPSSLMKVILGAANAFDWDINMTQHGIVRRLKWKVDKHYLENHSLSNGKNPHLTYYNNVVPDCDTGKGLVIIVPATLANAVGSIVKTAGKLMKRASYYSFISNKKINASYLKKEYATMHPNH